MTDAEMLAVARRSLAAASGVVAGCEVYFVRQDPPAPARKRRYHVGGMPEDDVRRLHADGASDHGIARALNVSQATASAWRKKCGLAANGVFGRGRSSR